MVKTLDQHISIDEAIRSGKPCIAGRRITVADVAIWHEWQGQSVDEIADAYSLSLAAIFAALAYYHDHRAEIDESIRDSEQFIESLKQKIPSKIPQRA